MSRRNSVFPDELGPTTTMIPLGCVISAPGIQTLFRGLYAESTDIGCLDAPMRLAHFVSEYLLPRGSSPLQLLTNRRALLQRHLLSSAISPHCTPNALNTASVGSA